MKISKAVFAGIVLIWSISAHAENKHDEGVLTVTATVVGTYKEPVVTVDKNGNVQITNPEYFYGTITEEVKGNVKTITVNY